MGLPSPAEPGKKVVRVPCKKETGTAERGRGSPSTRAPRMSGSRSFSKRQSDDHELMSSSPKAWQGLGEATEILKVEEDGENEIGRSTGSSGTNVNRGKILKYQIDHREIITVNLTLYYKRVPKISSEVILRKELPL